MAPLRTQRRPRTLARRIAGRAWRILTRTPYVAPEISDDDHGYMCDQELAAARRRDYRTRAAA